MLWTVTLAKESAPRVARVLVTVNVHEAPVARGDAQPSAVTWTSGLPLTNDRPGDAPAPTFWAVTTCCTGVPCGPVGNWTGFGETTMLAEGGTATSTVIESGIVSADTDFDTVMVPGYAVGPVGESAVRSACTTMSQDPPEGIEGVQFSDKRTQGAGVAVIPVIAWATVSGLVTVTTLS